MSSSLSLDVSPSTVVGIFNGVFMTVNVDVLVKRLEAEEEEDKLNYHLLRYLQFVIYCLIGHSQKSSHNSN